MKKSENYKIARHYESLGRLLYSLREKKNFTQRQVALKLGYSSPQFISNFERGIASPPLKKLRILMKIYDAPMEKLLDTIVDCERKKIRTVLRETN